MNSTTVQPIILNQCMLKLLKTRKLFFLKAYKKTHSTTLVVTKYETKNFI
jgi:hypothetical protein